MHYQKINRNGRSSVDRQEKGYGALGQSLYRQCNRKITGFDREFISNGT